MSNHTPPKDFPVVHYTAVAVPTDLARAIAAAAAKTGVLFEDQLLAWTQMGAEHSRLCVPKETRTGRNK